MLGLEFSSGPLKGQRVMVEGELTIGRNEDLRLDDGEVSRQHATLRPVEDGIEIEDLGSRNGTWVNGERITASTIAGVGAAVRVGSSEAAVIESGGLGSGADATNDRSAPAGWQPQPERPKLRGGTATRLLAPEIATFATIVLVAAGLIVYFAAR